MTYIQKSVKLLFWGKTLSCGVLRREAETTRSVNCMYKRDLLYNEVEPSSTGRICIATSILNVGSQEVIQKRIE